MPGVFQGGVDLLWPGCKEMPGEPKSGAPGSLLAAPLGPITKICIVPVLLSSRKVIVWPFLIVIVHGVLLLPHADPPPTPPI